MIKIRLSKEQQKRLESFRRQASSKDSEKALMVLMSNDGKTVSEISKILKRNPHTVRNWLKRYMNQGIEGLNRNFSPGRPNTIRLDIQEHIKKIIADSPSKQEKQNAIQVMVQKILEIIDHDKSIIYALDESHFSTEPYLVQGWFKKRWPPSYTNAEEKGKPHILWMLEHQNTKILLEEIEEVGK